YFCNSYSAAQKKFDTLDISGLPSTFRLSSLLFYANQPRPFGSELVDSDFYARICLWIAICADKYTLHHRFASPKCVNRYCDLYVCTLYCLPKFNSGFFYLTACLQPETYGCFYSES